MKIGKWIMLTEKLPTVVSPPKMSIFYATPWDYDIERVKRDWLKYRYEGTPSVENYRSFKREQMFPSLNHMVKELQENKVDTVSDLWSGVSSPTESSAMKIMYKGEQIKVWGHEYNDMKVENWNEFYPQAYDLIPDTDVQSMYMDIKLTKGQRAIFDAALVDGCTNFQALLVTTGQDIDGSPAPIGWFRIKPEYGLIYCTEYELEETD